MSEGETMEKPTFSTMKNGYNRYQVDDYIQSMQLQLDALHQKIEHTSQLKDSFEKEANEVRVEYEAMCETLSMKEKAAYDMTRIAMKEANLIVETAHKNADVIVRESLMMSREVLSELARIGKEANVLKGSMKEDLRKITKALEEFETPQVPNMDLLKKEN